MMKEGDRITIVNSVSLTLLRLNALEGRTGVIKEMYFNKDTSLKGAWICLDGLPFLSEHEWYIPAESIFYMF